MLKRLYRNITRHVSSSLVAVLFAAVLTLVLCHLEITAAEEQRSFENAYASIPVFFKVTDLDGSKVSDPNGIDGWITELFSDGFLHPNLAPYISHTHVRISCIAKYALQDPDGKPILDNHHYPVLSDEVTAAGISSTRVAEELTANYGGTIYWYEGYDESILETNADVCIVPEVNQHYQEMKITFIYRYVNDMGAEVDRLSYRPLKVVGYYVDPGNNRIYCPYQTLSDVHTLLGKSKQIEQLGAFLNDNDQLTALQETADLWFARPNPTGAPTPWGKYDTEYYPYALDIDDALLQNLKTSMKNSIRINQLISASIFTLSVGAGFLTGFLMIRSRKREIALMRTMGASHLSIFTELALERLLCIVAGILFGGIYGLWQPSGQLCLFGFIYFIGLAAALLVFLRKNLLTTIKEDE